MIATRKVKCVCPNCGTAHYKDIGIDYLTIPNRRKFGNCEVALCEYCNKSKAESNDNERICTLCHKPIGKQDTICQAI